MDRGGNGFKESPGLFLDGFYTESFLLAGKYPVWWLIPPELELHHADFIDFDIAKVLGKAAAKNG